jgi:hypothetical protein
MNYGVELEFVFGFQQDELELGHTNGVPNTLKKNLKYIEREEYPKFTKIKPVALPDHPYNSWAILEGGDPDKVRPVRTISFCAFPNPESGLSRRSCTPLALPSCHFYPLSQSRLITVAHITKLTA